MKRFVRAAAAAMVVTAAQAASVVSMSPQGEVAQVRQVAVTFSESVVAFGDLRLPDPFGVACTTAGVAGSGRWTSDRAWVFDFKEALPPGARCKVTAKADWKPQAGALTGRTDFAFSTGGPAVVSMQPGGGEIEEDQHFLLRLSGPAVEPTVAANAWCEIGGLGERLPLVVVGGEVRAKVLEARRIAAAQANKVLVARCPRPLPNGAEVRVVWGRGIASAADRQVTTSVEQRFRYAVRAAFTAEFTCERERADAPCLPIRPLVVRFSAPVPRELAAQLRLETLGDAGAPASSPSIPAGARAPAPSPGAALAPVFDKDSKDAEVGEVSFPRVLAENAAYRVVLPAALRDNAGRPLANAASFPLRVRTGAAPPIAKFAAAPFGIIEKNAEAALPVTLRHVQGDLRSAGAGVVRDKRVVRDDEILAWYARLQKFHETTMTAEELGRPQSEWFTFEDDVDAKGRKVRRKVERRIGTREIGLLNAEMNVRKLALPQLEGGDPRPFEVVGIPLGEPGYHVVEIESPRLGQALLDKRAPMFVRTGVLLTNLGVHFKLGRENAVVWVTTLDRGKPVEGADVTIADCNGKPAWTGRTDAKGLAVAVRAFEAESASPCVADSGWFVTAHRGDDVAFVFSSWQKGIEPWRFNVPTGRGAEPDLRAATVFDRTLFRAGETVSMKHFVRAETARGLSALPADKLPTRVKITHQGSGQEYTLPLVWQGRGRSATSTWPIPPAAALGVYDVALERIAGPPGAAAGGAAANAGGADDEEGARAPSWSSGSFRVEEFRLPLVDARLVGPKAPVIAPSSVAVGVQMNFFSGGPMGQAPLLASALLKPRSPSFAGYDEWTFAPPRDPSRRDGADADADDSEAQTRDNGRLVADKLALATDKAGAASLVLKELPKIDRPSRLDAEVTFADPNGETQTASSSIDLWPSAVVLGLKTASWTSARGKASFSVLALDTGGRPIAGQAVAVKGRVFQTITSRKRIVGGFYAYDNRSETKELGVLCSGTSDAKGLLVCDAALETAGEVELVAEARDAQGRVAQAASSVWVSGRGELWFAQDNDDRIDVLPEKKRYEPGETARLQVRMPYRSATALVAVEREGVMATQVVALRGDDPTVSLKIDPAWGPNVYVSVLALRGRIVETPWYSFFTWGWKEPLAWWRSYSADSKDFQAPTAMVDLSKPSFKLGVARLTVGLAPHTLQVSVTADKPQYQIRQKAIARVKVTQGGRPLAGTEVAFAAVDEGLLALKANDSWDLLDAMWKERAWGVETSTAQSEIIGRRHYGRKAVAAGGGGGRGATRELFDTLLVWKPNVVLDANGEATIEVPLNDSLTSFRLVAVADQDGDVPRFGSGSTSVKVTQDLQVLSGLPPLVRDGDRFVAMLTLRNTTAREMRVRATLQGTANTSGDPTTAATGAASAPSAVAGSSEPVIVRRALPFPPQDVVLAAGSAQEIAWPVDVPADVFSIAWEAGVEETANAASERARDRLRVTQLVGAAVPVRVLQATLLQLDGAAALPVAAPADALPASGPKRGGLVVAVQPKLTGSLPGMRRYFETYPFVCLEQKTSKSVGLKDAALWAGVAQALPTYLDKDGLANYFPPGSDAEPHGSDRLTAYVLAATHEAGFALPPAAQQQMLDGLVAFVAGRIERRFWSPRPDLDVRKLAAIEALARYGKAEAKMLGSINVTPNLWPTAAVIDWLRILRTVDGVADRARRIDEANQILRARLTYAGTTVRFSTEESDFWWWLMESGDANAAKLILAVLDDPAWKDELPKLVVGSLGRQKRGAFLTTTANLWGSLALDKFAAAFESQPIGGRTVAATVASMSAAGGPPTRSPSPVAGAASGGPASGSSSRVAGAALPASGAAPPLAGGRLVADWATQAAGGRATLPWPEGAATLAVQQQGGGRPWLTVQSLAAIPLQAPLAAGYRIVRSVGAVTRKDPSRWSRGDVLRVRLDIEAQGDMTWVVVSDPVPGGATILGSGLGRDSQIATRGEKREGRAWPAYEERAFEAYRSYYEYLPRGRHVVEYSVRLNNPGRFALPPTRVEAMYAPETFGEAPNAAVEVGP